MAATGTPTPNIGLRRPQGTDPASVDDINYNSNLIDTKLGAVGNTSVQEQINSLNSKITTLYNGTATWTIPFDISKYDIVFFVNVYNELIIIDNPKTADTEVYTQTSRYYSEEIPKVEFDYAFIVSSGGMYVDGSKCSQINYTTSGVSVVTPNMDEFKLIKAYGLQF